MGQMKADHCPETHTPESTIKRPRWGPFTPLSAFRPSVFRFGKNPKWMGILI
jgi:hypothetical protein